MVSWLRKRTKKAEIGTGGINFGGEETKEIFDVKNFVRTVENMNKAVKEGGKNFCPSKKFLEQAAQKWDKLDSEVKTNLKSLLNKCKR